MRIIKELKHFFLTGGNFSLLVVIFFGVLASRHLLFESGYFNMHDDLQMMRQLMMEKCFADLQIPCRWIPDMGYGYGFPLFNFYPPLPYLVGQMFRILDFSFVDTVKLTSSLSFILSGLAMYFLAKEIFLPAGRRVGKLGGIVSSIFYIWAPYHAVDVYVRGAMNEAWALVWFPVILLASYKVISDKQKAKRWLIALGLSWAGLLLSHNLMVLIFAPVFAAWCLLWIHKSKNLVSSIQYLVSAGLLAFGLAAFFTLPAIFEQKYVQVSTLVTGYYEYVAHFATISQLLLSRFWGYGPSVWLEDDRMSFQIGHLHWILSLIVGGLVIYKMLKERKKIPIIRNQLFIILFFIAVGWFSAFMAHLRSIGIWQAIEPLKFVQFPWRFLTITTFAFSFIAGSTVLFFKKQSYRLLVTGILVTGILALNWNYFRPEHGKLGPLTDSEKFTAAAWELQQTAGIYDYLPQVAKYAPKSPRKEPAEYLMNAGVVHDVREGTNWMKFAIDGEGGMVRANIFNFPNWRVLVDGKEASVSTTDDDLGRVHFAVLPGMHTVEIKLVDTPIRKLGNLISLVSIFALLFVWRRYSQRNISS